MKTWASYEPVSDFLGLVSARVIENEVNVQIWMDGLLDLT